MNRFFVEAQNIAGKYAKITGEDVAHIGRVLRLHPGDVILLCDGAGMEYTGRISSIEKQAVMVEIQDHQLCATEPACRVTLYQALPKTGKMETIIQKCVELGVYQVIPLVTERCVVRPGPDFEKKRARYQRVAYEAAKQSRRSIIPYIGAVRSLEDCDFSQHDLVLFAYEEERELSLKAALRGKALRNIGLMIGPEGGFEQAEADYMARNQAVTVTLGPRILRTETAGMAMLSMVMYELEG